MIDNLRRGLQLFAQDMRNPAVWLAALVLIVAFVLVYLTTSGAHY